MKPSVTVKETYYGVQMEHSTSFLQMHTQILSYLSIECPPWTFHFHLNKFDLLSKNRKIWQQPSYQGKSFIIGPSRCHHNRCCGKSFQMRLRPMLILKQYPPYAINEISDDVDNDLLRRNRYMHYSGEFPNVPQSAWNVFLLRHLPRFCGAATIASWIAT